LPIPTIAVRTFRDGAGGASDCAPSDARPSKMSDAAAALCLRNSLREAGDGVRVFRIIAIC
jgi:hypothetical protein